MTQMTIEATAITTAARNLPELPQVFAANMLYAQGYRPTTAERAAIVARADFFEMVGMARKVKVAVVDFSGTRIGSLEFNV